MAARSPTRRLFDSEGFYAALDSERQSRKINWKDVAEEADISASTLTRMAQGKRPDVDSLAALCNWSGLEADSFMSPTKNGASGHDDPPPLAKISTYLRSDPNLSPKAAASLDAVIKATYEQLREP